MSKTPLRRRKPPTKSSGLAAQLMRIERKLDRLTMIGAKLMKANEQVLAFLTKLNDYTNTMADESVKQTEAITELQADVNDLIGNQELSQEVKDKLQQVSDGLDEAIAKEKAQTETLRAIAAQNNEPLPDPVEPEEEEDEEEEPNP